ncbi:WD40-repeat-containing domain protein [Syncephalis fuscata]|nr:WD40-repeat-containing domain protein [Syncephalis fuscata]
MLPIKKTANAAFPSNTFVTYSSDGSVRFWNLHPNRPIGTRNIGGKELLHQFYVDPTWKQSVRRRDPLPRQSFSTSDAIDGTVVGVRAIDISPDARYLATGDRAGNLRVHDLSTFDLIAYHEAHDAEILTIDFSKPMRVKDEYLLASAGRDRLVHIFDVRDTFRLQQTLDEHSSSITGVKFADRGRRLISCGADKSIVFRSKHEDATFSTYHLHAGRVTIYDMDVDDIQNQMTVATQNRLVNVLDISSGKIINSVRPDNRTDDLSSAEGNLIRIALDPSGSYAVTAGTDKRVRLHDLGTGATVACVGGHSELITGVRITRDCARVISTSGDGCIFVWRIDRPVVSHMRSRAIKRGVILSTVRETSRSSRPAEPIPEGEVSDAPMRRQSSADTLRDNRRHSSGSKFANTTNNYFTGGRNSSLASGGHTSPLKSSLVLAKIPKRICLAYMVQLEKTIQAASQIQSFY